MPLPPPLKLLLNEALEFVVERCSCSHDLARAALKRAFKERALTLYDDRGQQVDIIRGNLDWEKSSISDNRWVGDYTADIWLYRRHLRRWIGPAPPHQAQSLPTTVRTRVAVEAPLAPSTPEDIAATEPAAPAVASPSNAANLPGLSAAEPDSRPAAERAIAAASGDQCEAQQRPVMSDDPAPRARRGYWPDLAEFLRSHDKLGQPQTPADETAVLYLEDLERRKRAGGQVPTLPKTKIRARIAEAVKQIRTRRRAEGPGQRPK